MEFRWEGRTPEGQLGREQLRRRSAERTLQELANGYERQANDVLSGQEGDAARDEVARFAKKITATEGPEQYEHLDKLIRALNLRKPAIFSEIPDDPHERSAFALALVRRYEQSLQ